MPAWLAHLLGCHSHELRVLTPLVWQMDAGNTLAVIPYGS